MATYRASLPQMAGGLFLTDGGIETTLIFHEGLDLPDFAAFHLLKTEEGQAALKKYFQTYTNLAKQFGSGLILESATWRASSNWGNKLGYTARELAEANRRAINLLEGMRKEQATDTLPMVISGCVGPRGDGYVPDNAMNEKQAEAYHRAQIETFADTNADMVCAITMNDCAEAVGVARAAANMNMPVAISFTVEIDGKLPTGQSLADAIAEVDDATLAYPAYYMINCAHPTHFEPTLAKDGAWLERIRGLRANASNKSHAELNEAADLDIGNPDELGGQYATLKSRLKQLNVMGGCCGTDHRHIEAIAKACMPLF